MSEQELDERVQRAVDNFMAGYGCCQSVVAAFSDLYGPFMVSTRRWPNVSLLALAGALVV